MFKSLGKQGRTNKNRIQGRYQFAPQRVFHSGCGEVKWKGREYGATGEAITKSTITAIKLLFLRYFQRKGLCNSGLKAKSTTFVRNITTIRLRSQFVISNGRGGNRYSTYAFTEQGVAMLSSVLRSQTAIEVNIRKQQRTYL